MAGWSLLFPCYFQNDPLPDQTSDCMYWIDGWMILDALMDLFKPVVLIGPSTLDGWLESFWCSMLCIDDGMILDAHMRIFKSVLIRSKPGFLLLVIFTRCVLSRNSQEISLFHPLVLILLAGSPPAYRFIEHLSMPVYHSLVTSYLANIIGFVTDIFAWMMQWCSDAYFCTGLDLVLPHTWWYW